MRNAGNLRLRCRSGIGNYACSAHRQPFVSRMRRMQQRLSSGVVVAKNGSNAILDRCAHPIETGKTAVLVTEKAERRQHPVDRTHKCVGRSFGLVGVSVPKRQEVGKNLQHGKGIAGNMSAIGKDLPVQFRGEIARCVADGGLGCGEGKCRKSERDADPKALLPVRHFWRHRAQIPDLNGKRA